MSNQGDGQQPPEPGAEDGRQSGEQPQPGQSGGHRLPGGTGGQRLPGQSGPQPTGQQPPQGPPPGNPGDQQQQGGDGSGQWAGGQQWQAGGQQQWQVGGQQPWATGGQGSQPPPWSTGETGPNVGPTMNNPQSSYYDRFSAASGEGLVVPGDGGGKGGRGKVLIGLAAALVVVIAAVAVFALTRKSDSPKQAASASTSQLPPVTATTWVNPTMAAGSRALKAGWQSQQANDPRGVYDVPKTSDWKLGSGDTFFGYADPNSGKTLVISKAPAQFAVGFCSADKNQESAWLGLVNVGKRDPSDAGPDIAQKFADAIALKKDGAKAKEGTLSAAKQITVDQGTIPALEYTITTAVGDPGACDKGKTYEVRTVTFAAGGKSYQLVSVRMLGVSKELPTTTVDEIFTTFRPN